MESRVNGVLIKYVEHGEGVPLLALHGAFVDHREIEVAVEAIMPQTGYRRIYPDLPGMGHTTADGLNGTDDVVTLLADFLDELGTGPALVLGHSYGGYLARGLAAARPDVVLGLALVCPIGSTAGEVPRHEAVLEEPTSHDELPPEQYDGFDGYFVVRTPATAIRYRDFVAPSHPLVDDAVMERLAANWTLDLGGQAFTRPTLIVAGRHDSTAGYRDAIGLLEEYPHATLSVVEDAGHALLHEQPDLVRGLLEDWLRRSAG